MFYEFPANKESWGGRDVFINHVLADWFVWSQLPSITLREAAYLSMNIDPNRIERLEENLTSPDLDPYDVLTNIGFHDDDFYEETLEEIGEIKKEVDKRFFVMVCNTIDNGGRLVTSNNRYGNSYIRGNISIIGAWAKSMGWKLPPEFPIEQLKTEQGVNENITKPPDEQTIKGQSAKESEVSAQCQQELIKAYKLIGLLLRHIAAGRKNFTQDWLAGEIEKNNIYGLGKTNINTLFSKGKKELEKQ